MQDASHDGGGSGEEEAKRDDVSPIDGPEHPSDPSRSIGEVTSRVSEMSGHGLRGGDWVTSRVSFFVHVEILGEFVAWKSKAQ